VQKQSSVYKILNSPHLNKLPRWNSYQRRLLQKPSAFSPFTAWTVLALLH